MVKLIKDGAVIGYAEHPSYVMLLDNGDFGLTDERHAIGISYGSNVYMIQGKGELEGYETVTITTEDAGVQSFEQKKQMDDTDTFVFSDQYMSWDGLKWVFDPENPIPLLRLPFANGIPNAFYRYTDGKRYVYVAKERGQITEENFDEVMELWDIETGESEGE